MVYYYFQRREFLLLRRILANHQAITSINDKPVTHLQTSEFSSQEQVAITGGGEIGCGMASHFTYHERLGYITVGKEYPSGFIIMGLIHFILL